MLRQKLINFLISKQNSKCDKNSDPAISLLSTETFCSSTYVTKTEFKKKISKFALLISIANFLLIPIFTSQAPLANAAAPNTSSVGYDFNLAFPPGYQTFTWTIYMSSDETGTATINWANGSTTSVSVNPGSVSSQEVIDVNIMDSAEADIVNKISRLSSTVPISVYICSYEYATSDCTGVYPISTWSTKYRSLYVDGGSERLTIMGGNDTATVSVTPKTTVVSSSSLGTMEAGTTYTITIPPNKLWSSGDSSGDFTGTLITSSSVVGVFAGNKCDNFYGTFPNSQTACDTAIQMLPPVSTWGTSYYSVNYKNLNSNGSGYRVLADQDTTTVTISGDTGGITPLSKTLNSGESWAFDAFQGTGSDPNKSLIITSTKPILVGHFVYGGNYSSLGQSDTGDASMSYLTPFQQFLDHYTIVNPSSFKASFINLVVPESSTSSIKLDGAVISSSEFRSISGAPWKTAQLEVTSGSHTLEAPQAFGIEVYGMDFYNSYAYTGGQNFSAIANVASLQLSTTNMTGVVGQEVCVPVSVLDANNVPVQGVRVDATINGVSGTVLTNSLADSKGVAKICYVGSTLGADTVVLDANGFTATATVTWTLTAPNISYSPSTLTIDTSTAMYPLNPTNTGGPVVTWQISPTLPSGLSFNTLTGVISGTPTTLAAQTAYTIHAINSIDTSTAIINLTIAAPQAPSISYSPSSYSLILDNSITTIIPSVTGTFPTWSVSPSLPSGLIFNTQNGQISGTPDRLSSSTNYIVTAQNSSGSETSTVTIAVVASPPNITYGSSAYIFDKNQAISTITPSNTGSPVTSWSISPTLPTGMAFNAVTGSISGTPTADSSTQSYTVTATNSGGTSTATFTITVGSVAAPTISYSPSSISATVNSAISTLTPTNSGGVATSWSVSPTLPAGLSLNTNTGVISGTPTASSVSVSYTVTATNAGGNDTATITIVVNNASSGGGGGGTSYPLVKWITLTLGDLMVETPFTFKLVAENATVYSIMSGSLPAGLSLNSATGLIGGTPTASGSYSFQILANNAYNTGQALLFSGLVKSKSATPSPTPTATATTSSSSSPSASPSPSASASPSPSSTPTPSPTSSTSPTPKPSPTLIKPVTNKPQSAGVISFGFKSYNLDAKNLAVIKQLQLSKAKSIAIYGYASNDKTTDDVRISLDRAITVRKELQKLFPRLTIVNLGMGAKPIAACKTVSNRCAVIVVRA